MQSESAQAMMERLAPFVGEWSTEAAFPSAPPNDTRGRTTFEWILGGQFVLQRSQIPHPDAPDALMVIGVDPDGSGYLQHYFDSRGVTRIYRMTFGDGRWELVRDSPDFSPLSFHQRFTAAFSDDGDTIAGRWEARDEGADWQLDFELTYSRLA